DPPRGYRRPPGRQPGPPGEITGGGLLTFPGVPPPQGKPPQPLQVQGVLPPGLPQPPRALRHRRPGLPGNSPRGGVPLTPGGAPLTPGGVPLTPSRLSPQASLTRSPPHAEGSDRRLLLSFDRTLVVKELSSEDVADVHGLLAHYHQYVVQCHGSTLLPRFLGMYRASVESEESYLLAMRNTFSHRLAVHRKYDLKGSLVSREASDKEKGKELPTLKDVDFLNKNEEVYFMGLIDVLTQYDARKKAAHAAKTVKHGVRGGAGRPPPQKKI
uniref:Phosphatidylinositol 5-phosphate 4-kinase type-2 gamma n=1 Tax=Anas zonorhyncha TaxID=75864 RepID=A0A8B9ZVL5_9AVES